LFTVLKVHGGQKKDNQESLMQMIDLLRYKGKKKSKTGERNALWEIMHQVIWARIFKHILIWLFGSLNWRDSQLEEVEDILT